MGGQAAKLILAPADFPGDWREEPPIAGQEACWPRGVGAPIESFSAHLAKGLADIQQRANLFRTAEEAEDAYEQLLSPEADDCMRSKVEDEVTAYSGGDLLKPLTAIETTQSDDMRSRRMSLTVESSIGPAEIFIDDIKGHAGRVVTAVKISSGLAPIPTSLYKEILALLGQRLQGTEGGQP
jgi:hypothetical protein